MPVIRGKKAKYVAIGEWQDLGQFVGKARGWELVRLVWRGVDRSAMSSAWDESA